MIVRTISEELRAARCAVVKPRMATIYDVAKRAGVSQQTVSVALNGARSTTRVSAQVRQRVLVAAAELGYVPAMHAQALGRGRSRVLAFVSLAQRLTPIERPIPHYLGIEIAAAAARHGYQVVEELVGDDRTGDQLLAALSGRRVEGVLVHDPTFHDPASAAIIARLAALGVPIVQTLMASDDEAIPAVIIDSEPGIAAAAAHLVALGHRRVAFIGGDAGRTEGRTRGDRFLAALADHRVAVPTEYIRLTRGYSLAEGFEQAAALLALPHPPTAIFADGDQLALGVLRMLYRARVRVPDAMSLISFDDVYSDSLYPPLTSVGQPLKEVAERACTLIAEAIAASASTTVQVRREVVPTQFTIRESTGPPPS
jgi:DNA-binding LacI/PurR family transcriptional regulator